MLTQKKHSLTSWVTSGELWIWMNAAAVGLSIAAVSGLLLLIAIRGLEHFWPTQVSRITLDDTDATVLVGEFVKSEDLSVEQYQEASGGSASEGEDGMVSRWLVKTGNRRVDPPDFVWVFTHRIKSVDYPENVAVFERTEWGNAYGVLRSVSENGQQTDTLPVQ